MKLSRTVAYAIQATLQLAQDKTGSPVPCSRMAAQGQMPERFLLQILRNLVTHGILQSSRGVEGGYTLERKPTEISLLDLIEAVDGPIASGMPLGDQLPPGSRDLLESTLRAISDQARAGLAAVKLSDLLPDQGDSPVVDVPSAINSQQTNATS
ncbi:MAG: Rrf2 family transcriptional regulator [Pirellulales bacterium]|nr:Rrf2 family transcriptional regulator [Pirellulales bacterium]